MRTWKYGVPIQAEPHVFSMPIGAVPLTVQMQCGEPCLWVKVNPVGPSVERRFRWVGTGHEFDDDAIVGYVGTVQTDGGAFVWHLWEVR